MSNGVHLPLIHLDAFLVDDIAQELHRGGVELTFLQFQVQFVCSEFLQNQTDMSSMFREGGRIHENVVYVDHNEVIEELPENFIHEPLEDSWGVGQSEGHDLVFIVSRGCDKCRLPFVSFTNADQIVCTA